ncbi:hypothetical protein BaRGS_00014974 [Batillaria attramentaria]|uniref:Receptor ligand binding region domain-containing protein n=1 Tax=Batillaria attramentaria TaxID=370345 RepID=A0ABD0L3M4_9CAEN
MFLADSGESSVQAPCRIYESSSARLLAEVASSCFPLGWCSTTLQSRNSKDFTDNCEGEKSHAVLSVLKTFNWNTLKMNYSGQDVAQYCTNNAAKKLQEKALEIYSYATGPMLHHEQTLETDFNRLTPVFLWQQLCV